MVLLISVVLKLMVMLNIVLCIRLIVIMLVRVLEMIGSRLRVSRCLE